MGGLCGATAVFINGRILRLEMNALPKYAVVGAVSIVAVVAYFVLAMAFVLVVGEVQ